MSDFYAAKSYFTVIFSIIAELKLHLNVSNVLIEFLDGNYEFYSQINAIIVRKLIFNCNMLLFS